MPRPSRLRRVAKWVLLGAGWTLFMSSGCLTMLLAYLWTTSFSVPPQSTFPFRSTPFSRAILNQNKIHIRAVDRDSNWVIIAEADRAWGTWDRNVYLYTQSEPGRFIIGQMILYAIPKLDERETRQWLQVIGSFSGKDPHLTTFLSGTVVFCNLPETANTHYAVKAVRVSYWFAMLIAVIPLFPLAAATVRRFRRFRRRRMNACLRCGYNLTGNESGVCPECATAVPNGVIAK